MTEKQPEVVPKNKGAKTVRQKRLSVALRENLRKRKSQSQERQKEKAAEPAV
jgi:hypothetical protein